MRRVYSIALLACFVAAALADPADVEETVNAATDDAVKAAKKATKAAIMNIKKGAPKVAEDVTLDASDEDAIKADLTQSVASTGAASTGTTGGTGSTGATGATGPSRIHYQAPACNGRGDLHRDTQKCKCLKRHGGRQCQFKKLNTGPFSHALQRHENHGRYVGMTMCLNGTPLGESDCVCDPGWAGYHCDKRECKNGRWVCGKKEKYCKVPTVCVCKPGFTGKFCSISITSRTGSTGASGATGVTGATGLKGLKKYFSAATGPKAEKPVIHREEIPRDRLPLRKRSFDELVKDN